MGNTKYKAIVDGKEKFFNVGENNLEKVHTIAAEEDVSYLTKNQIENNIKMTKKAMEKAAKEFDFVEAARLRDHIKILEKQVKS